MKAWIDHSRFLLAGSLVSVATAPIVVERIAGAIRERSVGGLHAVSLVFFAGAAASAILIATMSEALRGDGRARFERGAGIAARTALALALAFLALGALDPRGSTVFPHGRPLPVTWDVLLVVLYLANAVALGYFSMRVDVVVRDRAVPPPSDVAVLEQLAITLLPAALLFHTATASVLSLLGVDAGWRMLGCAVIVYLSTTISGLAFVLLVVAAGRDVFGLGRLDDVIDRVAILLGFAVPVLGFCYVAEMQLMIDETGIGAGHLFREMVIGPYAPLFWFAELGGVVVPFAVLMGIRTGHRWRIAGAALLVVAGTLVERWTLVVPPILGHAHAFFARGGYRFTGGEIATVVGVYALAVLACRALPRAVQR